MGAMAILGDIPEWSWEIGERFHFGSTTDEFIIHDIN
jgi:hypothetical protein